MRRILLTWILVLLGCGLTGCGYTFRGAGSVLPADVKKVYISPVENRSAEVALGPLLTDALQEEFERYGTLEVVESAGAADAVLYSRITGFKKNTGATSSGTDTALQYDTTLSVIASLARVSGDLLWRSADLSVTRSTGATSDVVVRSSADFASGRLGSSDLGALDSREVSRGQEEEASALLVTEVAEKIYREAVLPEF